MSKGGSSGLRLFASRSGESCERRIPSNSDIVSRPDGGQAENNKPAEESGTGLPPSADNQVVPPEDTEIDAVRSGISPEALRLIYEQLLADDPKVANSPKLFQDTLLDLIMAAKVNPQNGPTKFLRVFEKCKEEEDERSESQKVLFIPRLAYWLEGVRFGRSTPGCQPEQEWQVLLCKQQDLLNDNPNVTAITKEGISDGRDTASLYEVFCGLKVS